jgi:hypothetical protein
MRTPLALLVVLAACAPNLGKGGDAGAAASDGGTGGSSGGGGADAATGAGCGRDATTGVVLCSAISICPSLAVDPDMWPGCGYRLRGEVIDIECLCDGMLCPLGAPTTCAQAKQLLESQNVISVCGQRDDGRCTPAGSSSGTGGSGGSAPSGCDKTCQSQCGGDPSCNQLCGC